MALSAAVLACGNLLWLTETTLHRIVPWWAGFLILMIAGERLELTRLRSPKPWVRNSFRLAVIILIAGLVTSPWEFRLGVRIAGAGMIALALWLLRYDLAWQSIRQPGLPRFMAAGLIAGYFWLADRRRFLDLVRALLRRRAALRRHAARGFFRLRFLDDLRPCADHPTVNHPTGFAVSPTFLSPCRFAASLSAAPRRRRSRSGARGTIMGRHIQCPRHCDFSLEQYPRRCFAQLRLLAQPWICYTALPVRTNPAAKRTEGWEN